ncbi:response regulator [Gloeothece verrucosa]|uniref:Response regulator receiver protein n=1 Tax=Gloeothece verrucosa (strain PCC 7822) TaxID=497965 RepID=E0UIS8_GLOV7|nr:response regulator [Gloeothece verrucosa]ADN13387.1 response regulator receiver protein [Gloeothece verrucosa PCC 7822]
MTKRILIVDDDQDIRDVAQVAFEKFARWETITAASGAEGLEKAKMNALDAIVLDVSMPDMDGFSVFEKLQADPLTERIPVVLLTAKVLASDRQRFAQMGVAGVITKPFNPLTVWTEVAVLLGWDDDHKS